MDKWKTDFISLFALDMPVEDILAEVGKGASDILEARISDTEFDRQCDIALKSQKNILLSKIGEVERDTLRGKYNFMGAAANSVIKSLQWRLGYIAEFEESVKVRAAGGQAGEAYKVELVAQVEAV